MTKLASLKEMIRIPNSGKVWKFVRQLGGYLFKPQKKIEKKNRVKRSVK